MKPIHYPHSNTTVEEAKILAKRYDHIVFEDVVRAFRASGLGLTPVTIEKPKSYGTRHVIFMVTVKEVNEKFIFRCNSGHSEHPEVVLAHEKIMTTLAKKAGVAVNEIVYVDISRGRVPFDFQIQKLVSGEDLEDHFSGSKEEYDDMSIQIGEMTAKLHSIKLDGFGRFDFKSTDKKIIGDMDSNREYIFLDLQEEIAHLLKAKTISELQANRLLEYFYIRENLLDIRQGSLVHYDIADHNIMHENGKITGLIDWEAAVSSDPTLDIASMPTWKTHYPRIDKFLEGYTRNTSLAENFKEKYALYELRTLLWKTVFCINAGILNEQRKIRFTDSLKRNNI